jgi:hypothetical protein
MKSKEDCQHEPLIDTGVGYYYCPACKEYIAYDIQEQTTHLQAEIDRLNGLVKHLFYQDVNHGNWEQFKEKNKL